MPGYTGSIRFDGIELKKMSRIEVARKLALVPQKHEALFPYLTRDFILLGRYSSIGLLGTPSQHDIAIVEQAAADTGAAAFLDKPYSSLSGGELQLALIARALAQESQILVLDEPSSHLDFKNRIVVMDLIRRISEKRGVTLLMSLHEPNDVLQFADRAMVIYSGKIVADGLPADILDEKLLADYFGVRVEVTRAAMGSFFSGHLLLSENKRRKSMKLGAGNVSKTSHVIFGVDCQGAGHV